MSSDRFWAEAADQLTWQKPWKDVYSPRAGEEWFAGGRLNTCFNAVDRHVASGRGQQTAIFNVSAMTGEQQTVSYAELLSHVARVAGALAALGVSMGDRVVIYMPMVPEAIYAMLACARIGAIHSVVFGGFAAAELAKRLDHAAPRVLLTASCGLEPSGPVEYLPLVRQACQLSERKPNSVVVFQRPGYERPTSNTWIDWAQWLADASDAACVEVESNSPLYILYTSGTTNAPKGIVRDNAGHATALHSSMDRVYNVTAGDVFWAASDIGWVVGHSYIVYGPLLAGCTTVLFEGKPVGTPDAATYWRVAAATGAKVLFTAPTAIRAIRREDPEGQLIKDHDLTSLEVLFLAGERTDPETLRWAREKLDIPVIDHWWQTELGWPALAVCRGLDDRTATSGSAGWPVPGFDMQVLNEEHQPCNAGENGDIAIKLPLPPGASTRLWGDENAFEHTYLTDHPGYYTTGDAGYVDDRGCFFVMGRTDDVINVAGHRLSTGSMEAAVSGVSGIAECAVIGRRDDLKGQAPVALVVLEKNCSDDFDAVRHRVVSAVRTEIGPVAALKQVLFVDQLPKTRSGKVLRKTIRALANGEQPSMPATIDDPAALNGLRAALQIVE